jgi:hypothetical protein
VRGIARKLFFTCIRLSLRGSDLPVHVDSVDYTVRVGLVPCVSDGSEDPHPLELTVASMLWQCRTRAISTIQAPRLCSLLHCQHAQQACGRQGRILRQLHHHAASRGAVVDADIVDLVKMIKCAKGNEVLLRT